MSLEIQHFYDELTSTLTYIVFDEQTHDAVIVDPVLNFDYASGKTSLESINAVDSFLKQRNLNPLYTLETHAHADHLTGSVELKKRYPGIKDAIGENITKVQGTFKDIFNLDQLNTSGSQFDLLLKGDEILTAGSIKIKVIFTPGHTPACCSYLIEDMLFTGDALFMPDYGTGRCDFPLGSAKDLYHSIHEKLYKLPDSTRYFTCHDYKPNGRDLKFQSTIGESKKNNIQLKDVTTEEEFTIFREDRDSGLSAPKLLLPSIQVNIDAGKLPDPETNGTSYLKIPIK